MLVYHTTLGDLDVAERSALLLLKEAEKEPDPLARYPLLVNSLGALRCAGKVDMALGIHDEIIKMLSSDNPRLIVEAHCRKCRAHLSLEDWEGAQKALTGALTHWDQIPASQKLPSSAMYWHLQELKIRVAIQVRDLQQVESLAASIKELPYAPYMDDNTMHTYLSCLLMAELLTSKSREAIAKYVSRLTPLHHELRGFCGQDFETLALVKGLHFLNKHKKADSILYEYVNKHRRERGPLLSELHALTA